MRFTISCLAVLLLLCSCHRSEIISQKNQRENIKKGNELYAKKNFAEAREEYNKALELNPSNPDAIFNASLAGVRLASQEKVDTVKQALLDTAREGWTQLANTSPNATLASQSAFNTGNTFILDKKYAEAIPYYKQALRINPNDSAAKRNLRIAQLNAKNDSSSNNQNQNQNQNKDQDKDKNKKQDKDQNKKQQQQQQQKPQQPPEQKPVTKDAADRILQRNQNKENATRARMLKQNRNNRSQHEKNW